MIIPSDSIEEQRIHFTYKQNPDMKSLCQGDVLCKTADLMAILKDVHPYFQNDEYKYFMVLSQSCDLVRRDGRKCKTPYITIAAVRDYSEFLERTLISNGYAENYKGLLLVETRVGQQISNLVERVYNNTEPDYFFLYKEETLGFPKSMIAYLKVSIALKSEMHYQKLLEAKLLELSDEFKAKLGWLVGNMYSRVGTTDWESIVSASDRKQMIEDDIHAHCIIGSKEQLKQLKKKLVEGNLDSHDSALEYLDKIVVKSKYDELIETMEEIINTCPKTIRKEDREILLNTIKSRNKIKQIMKQ
jgi:hypothetical protein